MNRKIIYTDPPPEIAESLERSVTVKDYLPPPSELVRKVTTQSSIYSMDKQTSSTYKKKRLEYA